MACGGSLKRIIGTRGQFFVGVKECFELEANEQLVKIEVLCGQVMERIRFTTNRGRLSRWIGEANLSVAPRLICMQSDEKSFRDPSQRYIVGFFGSESSAGLLSFGIIVRFVKKQNIFSYKWVGTNEKSEDNGCDEKLLQRDKEVAIIEFAMLLKIRRNHLLDALSRSLKFARNLWQPQKNMDLKTVFILSNLQVIQKLTSWYFESIAFRLPRAIEEMSILKLDQSLRYQGRIKRQQYKSKTQSKDIFSESDTMLKIRSKRSHVQLDITNKNRDYYSKLINLSRTEVYFQDSIGNDNSKVLIS